MALDSFVDREFIGFHVQIVPSEFPEILKFIPYYNSDYEVALNESVSTRFELRDGRTHERRDRPEFKGLITRRTDLTSVEFSAVGSYSDNTDQYLLRGIQLSIPGSDPDEHSKKENEVIDRIRHTVDKYFENKTKV